MKIAVIDCSSSKVPEIIGILEQLGCDVTRIDLDNANNQAFEKFEAMVISGGPRLFTDPEQIEDLTHWFKFIEEVTCPILGICLGHQALGLANGARVFRDNERRKTEIIRLASPHPLIKHLDDRFEMATDHCEGISLPENYLLVGESEYYQVEIMANDQQKRYGVQFHPEVSGKAGIQIFRNFLNLVQNV